MTEFYSEGSITVTSGSFDFVGADTAWLPVNCKPGDSLNVDGRLMVIAEVTDATHGKFVIPYTGPTGTGRPYAIVKTSAAWGTNRELAVQTAEMIRLLTTIVVERTGIAFDAYGTLANRGAHDDAAGGFVYLSVDGTWTLWIKLSAATGDWGPGQTIEGAPGPGNELAIGTVTSGPAGATITGASPNQTLNLVLQPGADSTVPGPPNELTIGLVQGGAAADASITGAFPDQKLNLVLPKGDTGDDASIGIGSVTTVGPLDPATVTNSGTPGAVMLEFEIPRGLPGSGSVDSVNGDPGPNVTLDADDIDDSVTEHKFATADQLQKADSAVQPSDLGNAAAKNVGTAAGTVAAGDDGRIVGALQASVLTTRGDILTRNATVPARLAKGTQYQVLQAGADDPTYGAVNLGQAAAVTGVLPAANLPDASTAAEGVVELATAAEYRAGSDTTRALNVAEVWDGADLGVLTDGATIAVDFAAGFNFGDASNAPLPLAGNRTLGAPSNVNKNQAGVLWFAASASTRTLTLNAAWLLATGVEAGPYSITTTQELGMAYVVRGSSVVVTAIIRRG